MTETKTGCDLTHLRLGCPHPVNCLLKRKTAVLSVNRTSAHAQPSCWEEARCLSCRLVWPIHSSFCYTKCHQQASRPSLTTTIIVLFRSATNIYMTKVLEDCRFDTCIYLCIFYYYRHTHTHTYIYRDVDVCGCECVISIKALSDHVITCKHHLLHLSSVSVTDCFHQGTNLVGG